MISESKPKGMYAPEDLSLSLLYTNDDFVTDMEKEKEERKIIITWKSYVIFSR